MKSNKTLVKPHHHNRISVLCGPLPLMNWKCLNLAEFILYLFAAAVLLLFLSLLPYSLAKTSACIALNCRIQLMQQRRFTCRLGLSVRLKICKVQTSWYHPYMWSRDHISLSGLESTRVQFWKVCLETGYQGLDLEAKQSKAKLETKTKTKTSTVCRPKFCFVSVTRFKKE